MSRVVFYLVVILAIGALSGGFYQSSADLSAGVRSHQRSSRL